jgi:hypothetical protein
MSSRKREEVKRMWETLPRQELYILYSSPHKEDNKIKENERGGACSRNGTDEKRVETCIEISEKTTRETNVERRIILKLIIKDKV